MTKRAIITGATSGIGRALAEKLASEGYLVGATGRSLERLEELQRKYPDNIKIMQMDVTQVEELGQRFDQLVERLGGLDLCVINAGVGIHNRNLDLQPELKTIAVNVSGFVATLQKAVEHFLKQGRGHIVGISSIAALMGNPLAPAYNASKAFEMNYLEGIGARLRREGIPVTDIRPGFVATEMTEKNERMFWVATPEKAADRIYRAIVRKRPYAYITRRWRLIGWLVRLVPYSMRRIGAERSLPVR